MHLCLPLVSYRLGFRVVQELPFSGSEWRMRNGHGDQAGSCSMYAGHMKEYMPLCGVKNLIMSDPDGCGGGTLIVPSFDKTIQHSWIPLGALNSKNTSEISTRPIESLVNPL